MPRPIIDLRGRRFGRLVVVGGPTRRSQPSGYATTVWECRCDCGSTHTAMAWALKSGKQRSCGCLQRETAVKTHTRHGHASYRNPTREYKTWADMRSRCERPDHPSWKDYGGRGISVCQRWSEFQNFLDDMGPKPLGLSVDRINNDGNYEPGNCRWATTKQQAANRRPKGKHRSTHP